MIRKILVSCISFIILLLIVLGGLFLYFIVFVHSDENTVSIKEESFIYSDDSELNAKIQRGHNLYKNKKYDLAFKCFEELSDVDKFWAPMFLGCMYYLGQYVEKDINKALELLEISAENGNKYALSMLGVILMNDTANPQNIQKGFFYLKEAAEKEEKQAMFNLGLIYYKGLYDNQVEQKKAFYWFAKAASLQHSDALLVLATFYMNGINVSKDEDKALRYIIESAKLRNGTANLILYSVYTNGFADIKPDLNKALIFLTKAAKQGNPEAQILKGFFEVFKSNPSEAKKWLDAAKAQGYDFHEYIDRFMQSNSSLNFLTEYVNNNLTIEGNLRHGAYSAAGEAEESEGR